MKRYEKYKPTGIQWLPEIPEHWNIMQLRKYLSLVSIKDKGDKQLLSVTRENGVIERDIYNLEENHNFVPEDLNGYKYVTPGQFVINKMKSWQGSYGVSDYEGIVSPAYFVCDLNFPNKEFFSQAIRSRAYVDFFAQWSKGIRVGQWDLEPIALKSIPFFEPPIPEQNKIVAYLDKRITLIDNCKCQRERELQTLNELKQAEIASVVTRGLNPNVPMKDSGIFWQPLIPQNWSVTKLKHVLTKLDRPRGPEDELLVCSNSGEVKKRGDSKLGLVADSDEIYQGVRSGDLLIHGMDTWHGAIAVSNYNGMCTPVVHVCDSAQNKKYIALYLRNMANQKVFKLISNGVRQNTSDFRSWGKVGTILIPIPPIEEQNAIVEYIESKTNKIDTMIEALKAEIDRLTEYKQRLISDVVTGQIDVRGEQIQ